MDGDVGGVHGHHLLQGAGKALHGVGGQACNQIHIHHAAVGVTGQLHGVHDLGGGVGPAHLDEHRVLHGLGVDGNAVDVVGLQHLQLFPGNGVGAARLHRELHAPLQGQVLLHVGEHPVHLRGGQGSGGAASHVGGLDGDAVGSELRPGLLNLPAQGVHVGLHQGQRPLHVGRNEGAVGAPGRAEGDTHIQRQLFGLQAADDGQGSVGTVHGQVRPGGADPVEARQGVPSLLGGVARHHLAGGQLHRAHPGEGPPGGLLAQGGHSGVVEGQANHPLAHPVVLQPTGEVGLRLTALGLVHTPVPPQLGMGHHFMPPGEQFHLGHGLVPGGWCVGIFGFLAGEQGHHHLFHGVLVLVAHQIQLHPRLMASSMQKLVVRSRSKVEEPSWPGNTRQSPGSWARRLREWSS